MKHVLRSRRRTVRFQVGGGQPEQATRRAIVCWLSTCSGGPQMLTCGGAVFFNIPTILLNAATDGNLHWRRRLVDSPFLQTSPSPYYKFGIGAYFPSLSGSCSSSTIPTQSRGELIAKAR